MYLTILKLPDGRSSFDLDRRVNDLFREISAVRVKGLERDNSKEELYELPAKGAIEYKCSFRGNGRIELEFPKGNVKQKEILSVGHLLLLGFDQTTDYFLGVKSKIDSKVGEYIVLKAENNLSSKT